MRSIIWIAGFINPFLFGFLMAQPMPDEEIVDVVYLRDTILQQVLLDDDLMSEDMDIQPEIRFWRRVMNLSPDSCILNNADTREILLVFPTAQYDTLSNELKRTFKDSMIRKLHLPENIRLYVTYGKKHYYQFDHVIPDLGMGIQYFQKQNVDPWYAQAILLIESPGYSRTSPTGAKGRFQLMRSVALQQGLVINSKVDERVDFEKSSYAAASYLKRVCIPEARGLARARGLKVDPEALWFRLLVMHVYHAGSGNVRGALNKIPRSYQEMDMIRQLWHTHYRGFRNASQNYSQIAVAALLELKDIVNRECTVLCSLDSVLDSETASLF